MTENKYDKPFSHPRWNDVGIPEIIGKEEVTDEEKTRAERIKKAIIEREKRREKEGK